MFSFKVEKRDERPWTKGLWRGYGTWVRATRYISSGKAANLPRGPPRKVPGRGGCQTTLLPTIEYSESSERGPADLHATRARIRAQAAVHDGVGRLASAAPGLERDRRELVADIDEVEEERLRVRAAFGDG